MGVCGSQIGEVALHRRYELKENQILGQGTNSLVFRATHKQTLEDVAIKRVEKLSKRISMTSSPKDTSVSQSTMWEEEIMILRMCTNHPTILELQEVFETKAHVYLITELAAGGELFTALINEGAYSEWDAKRFIHNVFDALRHLHAKQIVHRDIKPENLLLTTSDTKSARIKVADFGSAKLLSENTILTSDELTWAYCAPEILETINRFESFKSEEGDLLSNSKSYPSTPLVPYKSDIWSVGIVLYVLLSGIHPFDPDGRQTMHQMVANILRGSFSLEGPMWNDVSTEAKSLLKLTLSLDPTQRPSASEALNHAWFHTPHTPRSPLRVSLCDGLEQYQRLMQKKFRTSVFVAMAAQSLRKSLQKVRNSKTATNAGAETGNTLSIGEDTISDKDLRTFPVGQTTAMSKVFEERLQKSQKAFQRNEEPTLESNTDDSSILHPTTVEVEIPEMS